MGDDAGARDAGPVDGGPRPLDAGALDAGGECALPSDCRGVPWASRWCLFGDGGFSCVDRQCVATCADVAGDTCQPDAGAECLVCQRDGPVCPADTCPPDAITTSVSSIECRPGVTPPFEVFAELAFVPVRGASCLMSVSGPDGGLGTVTRTNRFGPISAWSLPALGGWCIAHQLPTGAIRSSVACPRCTFVIEGL
jgi:hypothetical protein